MSRDFLRTVWSNTCMPVDRCPPWQWCEDHVLDSQYCQFPGKFRSANSSMVREVMET